MTDRHFAFLSQKKNVLGIKMTKPLQTFKECALYVIIIL